MHLHVHDHKPTDDRPDALGLTPWALFVVFLLGPCEPLIPLLMVPAAGGSWSDVALVVLVFAVSTVGTMLGVVTLGQLGLSRLTHLPLERYAHTAAGLTLVACGLLIHLGV